jgi:hypothetical protein
MLRRRPVDVLVALLVNSHGQETEELKRFFERFVNESFAYHGIII